ncbi:MAG TPA: GAF domain-containing serine/threonine-protein kinase [Galbitalea sp.]
MPATEATERLLGERYWLESVLGRGGMSTVYRATDQVLGRPVAIKLFTQSSAADTSRQESELGVLASLNHHGLVNLFDAGVEVTDEGQPHRYLVMEFVRGTDLTSRLAAGPITPRHIAEIGFDIAEALEYVHGNNVVHRDIKPSNILLVDYGNGAPRARAKLSDFGIALSEDMERMTREGATTGTAAYLSPEQAAGAKVGKPSDVYSLGLVLLECFTRYVEYPGTIVESAVARVTRNPVVPDDLPMHWRELLKAMTSRRPSSRPQPRELVASLRQLVIAESARHKDVDAPLLPASEPINYETLRAAYMDTLPDQALDRVTALAARLFAAPLAIISVVDRDRVWLKSHFGAEVGHILRSVDLTTPGPLPQETLVIEDALLSDTASQSPLVTGDAGLRFYAGVPLRRDGAEVIGTLSVLDTKPHTVTEVELANLEDLAALVMVQLDLRRESRRMTGEINGPAISSDSLSLPHAD